MRAEVTVAVAGGGKTTLLTKKIQEHALSSSSLAITFTTMAQMEVDTRMKDVYLPAHETIGWFAFLIRHIVRPYLPARFPGVIPSGLVLLSSTGEIPRQRGGWAYYFDDQFRAYSPRLATLAKSILELSDNAPIRRLEKIYTNIYLDEFQDLAGADLYILEQLMLSNIKLFVAGDPRQAVISTSRSSRLFEEYRGAKILHWFQAKETENLCRISYVVETYRFNSNIATFSDKIHARELGFPETISKVGEPDTDEGVFLVDRNHVGEYIQMRQNKITFLRYSRRTEIPFEGEIYNFGQSKGITRNHTAIYITNPIIRWLRNKTLLAEGSAAGFYVAVTRARHSVALVAENASSLHRRLHDDFRDVVSLWEPGLN